ncbi:hypothetical protein POTOM_007357 [Populus tomentosa]|uniref:Uncharacterized protein n=1 Tax=Populus tomentosa TaxID=118781 RepID=A0A8X8A9Z1_POPTO|nr:hypothetical protein POTOM_007357 [Populus tomentosa]
MEIRGPENDIRTSVPSSYSHQSSGLERRKDGNHNGSSVLTYTQTLDHPRQPSRSPNPDRLAIISSGSNSKTSSTSPGSRRSSTMVHSLQLAPPMPSPTVLHHHHHHQRYSMGLHTSPNTVNMVQPMSVAFGGTSGGTESSSEELNPFQSNAEGAPPPPYVIQSRIPDTVEAYALRSIIIGYRASIHEQG